MTTKTLRLISFFAVLLAVASAASAEDFLLKQYHEQKNKSEVLSSTMRFYVMGLGAGMSWLNTAAAHDGHPVYCPPPDLALAVQNY